MRYFLLEVFILISWQKNKSIILCKLCNEMFLKTPNKEVYGITIIIIYLVNLNFPPQTSHTVTLILQNYPDIKLFKNFCYIFKIIFFFAFSLFFSCSLLSFFFLFVILKVMILQKISLKQNIEESLVETRPSFLWLLENNIHHSIS